MSKEPRGLDAMRRRRSPTQCWRERARSVLHTRRSAWRVVAPVRRPTRWCARDLADDSALGVAFRVVKDGAIGFAATVDLSIDACIALVDTAVDAARRRGPSPRHRSHSR